MKSLKEITTILAGYQIRSKIDPRKYGDVRIVQMKDVDLETGFDPLLLDRIDLAGKKEPDWLQEGDVLFVGRGYRNFAVMVNIPVTQTIAAPQFFVIKANPQVIMPDYLTWYLNHQRAQRYFKQMSQSTSLPNITRSVLENCPIVIPPLEKQEKLAKLAGLRKKERILTRELLEKRKLMMDQVMDTYLDQF